MIVLSMLEFAALILELRCANNGAIVDREICEMER